MPSAEEYQGAGLYDPASDDGAGRLALLDWVAGHGFTVEEMQRAARVGGLERLPSDRRLLRGAMLTTQEAAEVSGLSSAEVETIAAALGFVSVDFSPHDDLGITESEAEAIGMLGTFASLFSVDESMALIRVLGASIGRIGEAAVSSFLRDIEAPHIEARADELHLAEHAYEVTGVLDSFTGVLDPLLRRHVMQAIERTRRATIDSVERYRYRYAIGFVDLVGFTEISGDMSSKQLTAFLRDFEGRAHDAVTGAGARIVKLIGDEVMFASIDPDGACRAASALMSGFAHAEGRVVPRGGLSYGDVLVRGGDYYGPVVNLAARLVDAAVPQELLVTDELAAAASECDFEPAGRRSLKGFADPVSVHSFVSGSSRADRSNDADPRR